MKAANRRLKAMKAEARENPIETSPGMYGRDPHGLFAVVGWITKAEMQAMIGEDSGRNANLTAVVEKIIAEFKEPPADWMVETGIEEEPEGQKAYAFVDRLRELVLARLQQIGTTDQSKKIRRIVTDEQVQNLRNNTMPLLLQLDQLVELVEVLGITYEFKN